MELYIETVSNQIITIDYLNLKITMDDNATYDTMEFEFVYSNDLYPTMLGAGNIKSVTCYFNNNKIAFDGLVSSVELLNDTSGIQLTKIYARSNLYSLLKRVGSNISISSASLNKLLQEINTEGFYTDMQNKSSTLYPLFEAEFDDLSFNVLKRFVFNYNGCIPYITPDKIIHCNPMPHENRYDIALSNKESLAPYSTLYRFKTPMTIKDYKKIVSKVAWVSEKQVVQSATASNNYNVDYTVYVNDDEDKYALNACNRYLSDLNKRASVEKVECFGAVPIHRGESINFDIYANDFFVYDPRIVLAHTVVSNSKGDFSTLILTTEYVG